MSCSCVRSPARNSQREKEKEKTRKTEKNFEKFANASFESNLVTFYKLYLHLV